MKGELGEQPWSLRFTLKWIDLNMSVKDGEVLKGKRKKGGEMKGENGEEVDRGELWQKIKKSLNLWIFKMGGIEWSWRVYGIPYS